jgi:hypothetical protein
MTEKEAVDQIIRLRKLNLSLELQVVLEDASQALAAGCLLEAEALLQNIEARFHYAQTLRAHPL